VFGEFPGLSTFILQRYSERLTYWPPSFLWLTSPHGRVWSLGAHFCGDLCGDVRVFLKKKTKQRDKEISLGKTVYPAHSYHPS